MAATPKFHEIRDPDDRVRALCQYGCHMLDIDASIPPKRYFRSGLEMIRMGNVYYEEGDLESAFVLYSKFISLFVEKLPNHPEYKQSSPTDRAINKKKLLIVFQNAEEIKKRLKERYAIEEAVRTKEEKRQLKLVEEQRKQQKLEEEKRDQQELEEKKNLQKMKLYEQELHLRELQEKAKAERDLQDRLRLSEGRDAVDASAPPPPYVDWESNHLKPTVDRSTKPDHFTHSGRDTGNQYGYRDVVVPSQLIDKFLAVALANTEKNVETCVILAGKLSQHAFRITHLLVPTQTGTPDSCSTDCEEDVFDYQDNHDLITLGWIHTHPSQTAFMSSVDLHTHCAYQLMMPEAVAIVCAPKFEQIGKFSLTSDYGVQYIANCRLPGFHPHPKDPPLYQECDHVKMDTTADVVLVDLRKVGR